MAKEQSHLLDGKLTPRKVREAWEQSTDFLRSAMWAFEENSAMLATQQWLERNLITNVLREIPQDSDRTRITADKLLPATRNLMARLLSRPLVFEVPPTASDDATVHGAHTAQSVLMDCLREKDWEDLREQWAHATWTGGTAAVSLDWDAEAGTPLGELEDGRPYGTGDLCTTLLTIQEVGWEPGTRNAERGNWWVRAQALPPKEVQARYRLKTTPKADANASSTPLARRGMLSRQGGRSEQIPNLTLVLTVYIRPNPLAPQGAVATVVGDEFVEGPKPWPFPFKDRLNLVVLRETPVPGQAHGNTILSTAVPLQCALNASVSSLVEHMKLAGNARLLVNEMGLEGVDELDDLPSAVVTWAGQAEALKPSWLQPPGLPQWVIEQPAMLSRQIDDVLAQHEISRGVAPKNVESGLGISVLVEQDTTPLGRLTREMARGFERLGTMALEIYEAKVREPRKARMQAPGKVPELVTWDGRSLAGQTQAVVPLDQVMPQSRAAMYAMAKEMADRFPELKTNLPEFARIAQLPDQAHLLEAIDPDAAKAEDENHLMAMGEVCVPEPFDNHATHIAYVNRFRKSRRYRSMTPEQRSLFDKHAEAHEVLAAEQAGEKVAATNVHPALGAIPTAGEAAPLPTPAGMPNPVPGPGSGGMPPPVMQQPPQEQPAPEAPVQ